jgi:hypothetical protein
MARAVGWEKRAITIKENTNAFLNLILCPI